jgi:predicted small lipoprotein YifL
LDNTVNWLSRLALIGVVAIAAFALASCGRKGSLDPPPSAALTDNQPAPRASLGEDNGLPSLLAGDRPQRTAAAPAVPPPPPPRSFFLDFLIGK